MAAESETSQRSAGDPTGGRCGRATLLLCRHASNEAVTGVTAPQGMADSAAAWNIWQLVCCNTRLLWEGQRSVVSAYRRCATDRCRKHTGTTKKKRNSRYNQKKGTGKNFTDRAHAPSNHHSTELNNTEYLASKSLE